MGKNENGLGGSPFKAEQKHWAQRLMGKDVGKGIQQKKKAFSKLVITCCRETLKKTNARKAGKIEKPREKLGLRSVGVAVWGEWEKN